MAARKPELNIPIDDIAKAIVKAIGKTGVGKKAILKNQIKKSYPMTTKSGRKLDKAAVKGMRNDKYQATMRNYKGGR